MEAYRKTIKKRIYYFRLLMLMACGLTVLTAIWGYNHEGSQSAHLSSFASGAQFGMAVGLLAGLIIHSRKYYRALKDPEVLRKLHIEETDERYKTINLKVSNLVYYIMLYGGLCACIVAGFFSTYICVTLITVVMVMITLRGVVGIYYRNKY